jgi:hypothetical protein
VRAGTGDPLVDIRVLEHVDFVMKEGRSTNMIHEDERGMENATSAIAAGGMHHA